MTRQHRHQIAYPALWRAIDGALRDAVTAHPDIQIAEMRRASIVKRAVGSVLALQGAGAGQPAETASGARKSPLASGDQAPGVAGLADRGQPQSRHQNGEATMTTPTAMPPRIVCFPDGFAEGCGTWFTPDQNAAALPEGVAYVPEVRVVPEDAESEPLDLVQQSRGRAAFLRDRGEVKTPDMLEDLAARLAEVEAERDEFMGEVGKCIMACKPGPEGYRTSPASAGVYKMRQALEAAEAKLAASEAREAELETALHDAINAPKGVVPKSAEPFYSADRAALQDTAPATGDKP